MFISHHCAYYDKKTFASQSSFLTSQFWNSPTTLCIPHRSFETHPLCILRQKTFASQSSFLTSQFWNLPHFRNSQTQLIVFLNVGRARGSNSKSLMSDNPGCYKPSYSECGVCSKCFKIKYICYCPEKWRNIFANVILHQ